MGEAIVGRCVRRVESLPPGYWPIGKKTGPTYLNVCRVMIRILDSRSATPNDAEIISRAKGFYGKAYDREKSGMPDWHSVSLMLAAIIHGFEFVPV